MARARTAGPGANLPARRRRRDLARRPALHHARAGRAHASQDRAQAREAYAVPHRLRSRRARDPIHNACDFIGIRSNAESGLAPNRATFGGVSSERSPKFGAEEDLGVAASGVEPAVSPAPVPPPEPEAEP